MHSFSVIVLGIQDGTGWAVVDALRRQSWKVAALYDTRIEPETVPAGQGINLPCDTAVPESVEQAVIQACQHLGNIDGLVCLADHDASVALADMTMSDFNRVLEANMTYAMRAARQIMRLMIQKHHGSIVFITPTDPVHPRPGQIAYAAAFGGLESFARSAAMDGFRHRVRVNCLMVNDRKNNCQSMIRAIQYLLDEESSYVTGSSITVGEARITGW